MKEQIPTKVLISLVLLLHGFVTSNDKAAAKKTIITKVWKKYGAKSNTVFIAMAARE